MTNDNDDPGFPLSGPRFNAFRAVCMLFQTDHANIRRIPPPANHTFRVWAVDPVVHCKMTMFNVKCSHVQNGLYPRLIKR